MTISFYENGSDVVAVETGMPEHQIRVGVGSTHAEAYLARMLEESVGETSDDGPYCLYWDTVSDDESGPSERYATLGQAQARAQIANRDLHQHNPGDLLCGYSVRHIVDDEWVPVEPE
jgi:hypothetical protein